VLREVASTLQLYTNAPCVRNWWTSPSRAAKVNLCIPASNFNNQGNTAIYHLKNSYNYLACLRFAG
jgi:hypothetical protein